MSRSYIIKLGIVIAVFAGGMASATPARLTKAELGRALFFDPTLSLNRSQSCATCHDPARAFSDPRDNGIAGAASLGDDGVSLGDRNTPSIAYAALTPEFRREATGVIGGLFLDGRAANLVAQAAEPILNPAEMGLPNAHAVLERVRENPSYVAALRTHYGAPATYNPTIAVASIADSIATFESGAPFVRFDSKYDRYLRGDYKLTALEELGRSLFFSPLTNCASCHLLETATLSAREPFTNYRYHNIGLPANVALRRAAMRDIHERDDGLAGHPSIDDATLAGKFKVPSLRNVAVTAPYMHNGIFRNLKTAIVFYNQYIVLTPASLTNPETGLPWGAPEVGGTIDKDLLGLGQPIDDGRARALIAFLRTLTDARYEHLLAPVSP